MATYLKTYSGLKLDPVHPEEKDICIRDIAHALSLVCRGNGQTTHFYSVGQHCLNCEREAFARGYDKRIRLACLLHDAAEAYMSDLIRPIKVMMPEYSVMESRLLNVIFNKYGLSELSEEEWKLVKEIDDVLLEVDLAELLKEPAPERGYRCLKWPDISFRPFTEVEEAYIKKAEELGVLAE